VKSPAAVSLDDRRRQRHLPATFVGNNHATTTTSSLSLYVDRDAGLSPTIRPDTVVPRAPVV